jgi:hypothetical protein
MYPAEVFVTGMFIPRLPSGRPHASAVKSLLNANNLSEKFFCKNANIPKLRRAKVQEYDLNSKNLKDYQKSFTLFYGESLCYKEAVL